jgi:hypothetical protein
VQAGGVGKTMLGTAGAVLIGVERAGEQAVRNVRRKK